MDTDEYHLRRLKIIHNKNIKLSQVQNGRSKRIIVEPKVDERMKMYGSFESDRSYVG